MKDRDEVNERRRSHAGTLGEERVLTGWGSTLVGIVMGAAIAGNLIALRRRLTNIHNMYEQATKSARSGANARRRTPSQQQQASPDSYSAGEEESRHRWAEHVREMERIRHKQAAFERERARFKRNFDSWQERSDDHWEWRRQGNRWEWQGQSERVWQEESADGWRRESQRTATRSEPSRGNRYGEHVKTLGLNPSRSQPYTETEIKAAFREQALKFHPDTNPANKADAEKKFQEVMNAYNKLKESKFK